LPVNVIKNFAWLLGRNDKFARERVRDYSLAEDTVSAESY